MGEVQMYGQARRCDIVAHIALCNHITAIVREIGMSVWSDALGRWE